jgi:hypothetical protein
LDAKDRIDGNISISTSMVHGDEARSIGGGSSADLRFLGEPAGSARKPYNLAPENRATSNGFA